MICIPLCLWIWFELDAAVVFDHHVHVVEIALLHHPRIVLIHAKPSLLLQIKLYRAEVSIVVVVVFIFQGTFWWYTINVVAYLIHTLLIWVKKRIFDGNRANSSVFWPIILYSIFFLIQFAFDFSIFIDFHEHVAGLPCVWSLMLFKPFFHLFGQYLLWVLRNLNVVKNWWVFGPICIIFQQSTCRLLLLLNWSLICRTDMFHSVSI